MVFFCDLFREYRESKCMTLQEVGDKIGISKQTVQKWEKGKVRPRPASVYKLAKCLGVSVVDISDLKPEKELTSKKEEVIPADDFFKIVLKNWPELTNEQRGKVASDTVSMVETNRSVPPCSTSLEGERKRA